MADLQGLSRCLVKYFNISGSEFVGSCVKLTGATIYRVPRGEVEMVTTPGVGNAVVCSVARYVEVVSVTKRWSVAGTCVYGVTVTI